MRRLVPVLAILLALSAACGRLPTDPSVHLGSSAAAEADKSSDRLRSLPLGPHNADSPAAVVRGFLRAQSDPDDGHGIARQFLTPEAATRWDDKAGSVIYDPSGLQIQEAQTCPNCTTTRVEVAAPKVATVDRAGLYTPANGPAALSFALTRAGGQWRIVNPPEGLRIASTDVSDRAYRRLDVYFLTPDQARVVPDPRLLAPPPPGQLPATELVRALLDGPSSWLAPAVTSAFPTGTRLLGVAGVEDGVVTVNFSAEAAAADPVTRSRMSAQLAWTLPRQLPAVSTVAVLVQGRPFLRVTGSAAAGGGPFASYDPDAIDPDSVGYFVSAEGLVPVPPVAPDPDARVPRPLQPGVALDAPAVALSSDLLASRTAGGHGLLLGSLSGRLEPVPLPGPEGALTPPSWGRGTGLWVVRRLADGQQAVLLVDPADRSVRRVEVPELAGLGAVTRWQVSRDGTRVAVVAGPDSALLVGRVRRPASADPATGLVVDGFRPAAPDHLGVRDVAWAGGAQIALLAPQSRSSATLADPDPMRLLPYLAMVDGFATTPFSPVTEAQDYVQLAALPRGDTVTLMLQTGQGRILRGSTGSFTDLGSGHDPTYPG